MPTYNILNARSHTGQTLFGFYKTEIIAAYRHSPRPLPRQVLPPSFFITTTASGSSHILVLQEDSKPPVRWSCSSTPIGTVVTPRLSLKRKFEGISETVADVHMLPRKRQPEDGNNRKMKTGKRVTTMHGGEMVLEIRYIENDNMGRKVGRRYS